MAEAIGDGRNPHIKTDTLPLPKFHGKDHERPVIISQGDTHRSKNAHDLEASLGKDPIHKFAERTSAISEHVRSEFQGTKKEHTMSRWQRMVHMVNVPARRRESRAVKAARAERDRKTHEQSLHPEKFTPMYEEADDRLLRPDEVAQAKNDAVEVLEPWRRARAKFVRGVRKYLAGFDRMEKEEQVPDGYIKDALSEVGTFNSFYDSNNGESAIVLNAQGPTISLDQNEVTHGDNEGPVLCEMRAGDSKDVWIISKVPRRGGGGTHGRSVFAIAKRNPETGEIDSETEIRLAQGIPPVLVPVTTDHGVVNVSAAVKNGKLRLATHAMDDIKVTAHQKTVLRKDLMQAA